MPRPAGQRRSPGRASSPGPVITAPIRGPPCDLRLFTSEALPTFSMSMAVTRREADAPGRAQRARFSPHVIPARAGRRGRRVERNLQPGAIPPFQSFLEDHRNTVYRFLMGAVGPNEADDAFQETFLAALRAYPKLRDGDNLRGWVLAIAT